MWERGASEGPERRLCIEARASRVSAGPGHDGRPAGRGIPIVRVFVSSPQDVAEERQATLTVLRRLQAQNRGRVLLLPQMWEQEALAATAGFQQEIDRRIPPSNTDVAVFVLWSRLGSPLSKDFALEDGRRPTGTEWEFLEASEAAKKHGGGIPHILVYRKVRPLQVRVDLPATEAERQWAIAQAQWKQVEAFFERHFRDSADATFTGSFHAFESTVEYAEKLERHLSDVVEERLRGDHRTAETVVWKESPWRGLDAYGSEHGGIFFGRRAAVHEVLARLRAQTREGRSFVLVVGASGSGKSSLVQAGLLPLLDYPGALEPEASGGTCRRAVLRPSDRSKPIESLAAALVRALPELEGAGTEAQIAAAARGSEGLVALVRGALSRGAGKGRLVLVLDQLEEMFTHEGVSAGDRAAFAEAVGALARSGLVWVIATLRGDFYGRLQEVPAFLALKEGGGQYDLLPPDAAEIAEIVRRPAEMAGLSYEHDAASGRGLEERIVAESVAGGPDALPLLAFALQTLYEGRTPEGGLVARAYPGIEGAVRARADAEWEALTEEARGSFPHVLRELVEVEEGVEGTATARRVPLSRFDENPGARAFIERFVSARLLTVDDARDGARVRVAHESLLRVWPRARERIQAEAELLRIRTRLRSQAARWDEEKRPSSRLLAEGKPLEEGRLLRLSDFDLDERERAYLESSERRATTVRRVRRGAVAAIAVLAVLSVLFGLRAEKARRDAEEATESATKERDAKDRTLRSARALGLANASREALEKDPMRALLLAAEAVRLDDALIPTTALHDALIASQERAILRGHEEFLESAVFSPDGTRILTASNDNTARLWDLQGKEIAVLRGHGTRVLSAVFSPDGTRILTASADKTARLWNTRGEELAVLGGHDGWVNSAVFSPDGTRVATVSDRTARLWDLSGQEVAILRGHESTVWTAEFSPDGTQVLTASSDHTARLWDLSGQEVAVLRGHEREVTSAVFAPDGTRVLTASADKTARHWNVAGNELSALRGAEYAVKRAVLSPDGARALIVSDDTVRLWDLASQEVTNLRGHQREVKSAAFSPDGTRILTASGDRTARLWDLTGKEIAVLRGHEDSVLSAVFSADGTRALTASWDDTARLWDLARQEVAVLRGHEAILGSAVFSPDGTRALTSSIDETARLWDLQGKELAVLRGHETFVATAVFSPDGARVLTASSDGTARIWNPDGVEVAVLRGHEGPLWTAVFSSDGSHVLTASKDATARLWDLTGKEVAVLRGHEKLIWSAVFSPDGTRVVTASADQTSRIWDLAGNEILVLRGHESEVWSAVFSPDGTRVVTASADSTARLWDLTGETEAILRGHEAAVRGAAFSPDGRHILTRSADGTLCIWNLGGKLGAVLRGHELEISTAVFSPDGTRILSASHDGTARLWDRSGQAVAILRGHEGAIIDASFSPDGRRVLTASADGTAQVWAVHTEDLLRLAESRMTRSLTPEEERLYGGLLPEGPRLGR